MSNFILFTRISVLSILIFTAYVDWQKARLQESKATELQKAIALKDETIASLTSANLSGATDLMIERAKHENGVFLIHAPEAGCPAGWESSDGLFEEKDGSRKDGCEVVNQPAGDSYSLDYLGAGESIEMSVQIALPDGSKKL